MDFGRLKDVSDVDFSLPPLAAGRSEARSGMSVYLGTPTLAAPHFARRFYPTALRGSEHMGHYAQSFDALELNSSFYGLPTEASIASWRAALPKHFKLSPKISKLITHEKRLRRCASDLAEFCDRFAPFGQNLGRAFLQLPPDLGYADGAFLKQLIEATPAGFPLAVEFRDPSWFEKSETGGMQVKARVIDYLNERGVALVLADVAGRRDVCHGSWSASSLLVRFQGYDLVPSDFSRLESWADRLAELREQGLREVHFFLHQKQEGLSLDLAETFVRELQRNGFSNLADVTAWKTGRQVPLF